MGGGSTPVPPVVPIMDVTSLTNALKLETFQGVIQSVLPLVGVAVLVGFLFYVIRWAIGLFRGI